MKDVYEVNYVAGDEPEVVYLKGKEAVKEFIAKPEIEAYSVWKNVTNEFKAESWED